MKLVYFLIQCAAAITVIIASGGITSRNGLISFFAILVFAIVTVAESMEDCRHCNKLNAEKHPTIYGKTPDNHTIY